MVVLDTHTWIWAVNGDPRLGKAARDELRRGSAHGGLLVPTIAVWEVAMLEVKGRLSLEQPIERWVADALAAPDYHLAELTPAIAVRSARLPDDLMTDPSDRMIVATAMDLKAPLATRDSKIHAFARTNELEVIPI